MSLHDCLNAALAAGETDRVRAAAAAERFQDLTVRYERAGMARHAAEAAALSDLKEATRRAVRSRYHAVINQLVPARELQQRLRTAPDPVIALRNIVEFSARSGYTGKTVRSLSEAYTQRVNAIIGEVLKKHGTNVLGQVRSRASFLNVILEAHGRHTGDAAAKNMAEALNRAQDYLRTRFNELGGDIGRLDHYGLPHSHDAMQLRRAGREVWKSHTEADLDWSKIINLQTGRAFADSADAVPSRSAIDKFLDDVFDSITTRGWDDRDPRTTTGGRALYNQRSDHRVLHFKPEGWLRYNQRYGTADPYSAMVNGLHRLANDVARMEVLGANPHIGLDVAINTVEQMAAKAAADGSKAGLRFERDARRMGARVRAMMAHQDGSANIPGDAAWASFMSGVRSTIVATRLGSAILSSTTDLVTISMGARVSGLNPANVLGRAVGLMASGSRREVAARLGYIAGTLADAGGAYSRFFGDTMATGIPQRIASFTLRVSGLSYWTDMARTAFRMEFSGYLADNVGRAFDAIDGPLKRLLQERGITPEDWAALSDPDLLFRAPNGSTFLSHHYMIEASALSGHRAFGGSAARADDLGLRLSMMIQEQLELAVPSMSLEGRARFMGTAQPGTLIGEMARSTTQFKSFALSLTMNQYRRFLGFEKIEDRAAYAFTMGAGLLVLGAAAVQLKELAKGRDPRPMDTPTFWMAAQFQGGGLGIFGDFFASETNRFGGGLAQTLGGPVVGLASDTIGLVASPVARTVAGGDAQVGREVANYLRFNTPVLSSLWQVRAGYDRGVADTLQRFLDPEAEQAWRRQEQKRRREVGNSIWWDRGRFFPQRAPDLGNALGDSR